MEKALDIRISVPKKLETDTKEKPFSARKNIG